MSVIWKDVIGFEGFYQVSNTGCVRSVERTVLCSKSRKGFRCLRGKLLKTTIDSLGYCKVTLVDQDRKVVWKVHRLVAGHFLVKPEGKDVINHIDNDRSNNCVTNLEWCTPKENTNHMHVQGRNYAAYGYSNPAAKLTNVDIENIRSLRDVLPRKLIATQFGISPSYVGRILKGEVR